MKIFFSLKPPINSFGGGAFFVKNIINYLGNKNIETTFELEKNIDIIFIIDPRKSNPNYKKYSVVELLEYKNNNPNTKIIYRVNECDIKREVSINIEPLLVETMKIADYVVFVSKWLQKYFIEKYKLSINSTAILNGCNLEHFTPSKKEKFLTNKIKLVTHHWSNNYLKGFHIYNALDKLLENRDDIEFTYIGNYNQGYQPKNINLLPVTSCKKLGDLLKEHDIYLTATQNEPGAMHYLEGLVCGLPILYCENGGGAQEICCMAGEEYSNIETLLAKISLIKNNYKSYTDKINYKYLDSQRCCEEYYRVIINILN